MFVNREQIRQLASDGTELMRHFLPNSPFVGLLGVEVECLDAEEATLRLPFRPELVTVDDMVHGGALAALADITAMTAAWCGTELPEQLRGVTTSLAMEFLAPANAQDLLSHGRPLRRGATLTSCEVDIVTTSGTPVAKALVNYKVG